MAVVATRASEAATNTVTKLDLSRAANSIVASCVLSPSSARNTAPNTVASSLRPMGGLPRFVGIEIGEFTKDRQHEVDPRRLHHLADRAPETSLLFGICNRADEHRRFVQAIVEAVPNRNQLFSGIAVHARILGATMVFTSDRKIPGRPAIDRCGRRRTWSAGGTVLRPPGLPCILPLL